jgi:hypothetical protein
MLAHLPTRRRIAQPAPDRADGQNRDDAWSASPRRDTPGRPGTSNAPSPASARHSVSKTPRSRISRVRPRRRTAPASSPHTHGIPPRARTTCSIPAHGTPRIRLWPTTTDREGRHHVQPRYLSGREPMPGPSVRPASSVCSRAGCSPPARPAKPPRHPRLPRLPSCLGAGAAGRRDGCRPERQYVFGGGSYRALVGSHRQWITRPTLRVPSRV